MRNLTWLMVLTGSAMMLAACTGTGATSDGALSGDSSSTTDAGQVDQSKAHVQDSGRIPVDGALTGDGGSIPQGVELNPNWIGGACASAANCTNTPNPICEPNDPSFPGGSASDFPNGMCSQACQLGTGGAYTCPDTDVGSGTLNTVTRCISANGTPRCAASCDFTKSPTGCRTGYTCVLRQRYGQPDKIYPICLPSTGQKWPGETTPVSDVGGACTMDTDCHHLSCLTNFPGGYCVKSMCNFAGCPSGSDCFNLSGLGIFACIKTCGDNGDCRTGDGYICDGDQTCWPDGTQPPTTWNPTACSADCANAWADGISPCSSSAHYYVVVRKSARNLALCQNGGLVKNYRVGLGPNPIGPKQWEGDGRTPEGTFYVAALVPNSSYYKAFLISYPDNAAAVYAYNHPTATQQIDQATVNAVSAAQNACQNPPQTTELGGSVEIHGRGSSSDWTAGCIALEDADIDELWSHLTSDDTIVVIP